MPHKTGAANLSDQVSGKTIRLSWTDGPTKGTTQEHVFHKDGTVEWRSIEKESNGKPAVKSGESKPAKRQERPVYMGTKISKDVCMISCLTQSGYTLTAVLNCMATADDKPPICARESALSHIHSYAV